MHIEHVRFDRVFDVQARTRTFSFASEGASQHAIRLPGRIVPHQGAHYAVALARRGDWRRVLGWREIGTREAVVDRWSWLAVWGVAEAMWWLICAVLLVAAKTVGPGALLVFLCAIGLLAWHLQRRNRMVRQALLAAA